MNKSIIATLAVIAILVSMVAADNSTVTSATPASTAPTVTSPTTMSGTTKGGNGCGLLESSGILLIVAAFFNLLF